VTAYRSCGWTYPANFAQFCEHDDNVAVVLPQHSPEIFGRLSQRTLRRDISPPKAVTLRAQTAIINIRLTRGRSKRKPCMRYDWANRTSRLRRH